MKGIGLNNVLTKTKERIQRKWLFIAFESILNHFQIVSANISIIPLSNEFIGKEGARILEDSEDDDMHDLRMVMDQSEAKKTQAQAKLHSVLVEKLKGASCLLEILQRKINNALKDPVKKMRLLEKGPRNLKKMFCRIGFSALDYKEIRAVSILASVLFDKTHSELRNGFNSIKAKGKRETQEDIVMFESFGDPKYLASIQNQVAFVAQKKENKKTSLRKLGVVFRNSKEKGKLVAFLKIKEKSRMDLANEKEKAFESLKTRPFSGLVSSLFLHSKAWAFNSMKNSQCSPKKETEGKPSKRQNESSPPENSIQK